MTGPLTALLPDGRRLHLQHGPIDLIIEAFGEVAEVEAAYRQATARFGTVLSGLVAELPGLRRRCRSGEPLFEDAIARRMARAACPYAPQFITPMAAVAGAVADEVLNALCLGRRLQRAYVNNGGDIAIYLNRGARFDVGLVTDPRLAALAGALTLDAAMAVRGIATSGRHGRSLSRGIADTVTVLAATAAEADAAATMIANAVDLPGSPKISRCPAHDVDPDSDLGARAITIDVADLSLEESQRALSRGTVYADELVGAGRIHAAALTLDGQARLAWRKGAPDAFSMPGRHTARLPQYGEAHA